MASTRTGLSSSSYSIVTWVLPSGTQVRQRAVLAHGGELLGEAVRDRDRQRHQLGRLVAGEAEHQALVAGALEVERVDRAAGAGLVGGVDALRDVGRLRVEGDLHGAGLTVEALDRGVVADLQHAVAGDPGDVDVRLGGDLAADEHHARGDERLAGDPALRVVGQQGVEDAVADLVGNLVRVTLGHGLGREEAAHSSSPGKRIGADGQPAGQHWMQAV